MNEQHTITKNLTFDDNRKTHLTGLTTVLGLSNGQAVILPHSADDAKK
jgi:hypothetical protein